MATANVTRDTQSTGNNWAVLASAGDTINEVVATPLAGAATISLARLRGTTYRMVPGPIEISQSSSVLIPVIVLAPGATLVARSNVAVDWVAGGYVEA